MAINDNHECVHKLGPQCYCSQAREDYAEACLWAADAIEGSIIQGGLTERQINAKRMLQLELTGRAHEARTIPMRLPQRN